MNVLNYILSITNIISICSITIERLMAANQLATCSIEDLAPSILSKTGSNSLENFVQHIDKVIHCCHYLMLFTSICEHQRSGWLLSYFQKCKFLFQHRHKEKHFDIIAASHPFSHVIYRSFCTLSLHYPDTLIFQSTAFTTS